MRIAHVIRSDGFAGVETLVLRLALAQRGLGDDVAVIGGAENRMRPVLEGAGAEYRRAHTTFEAVRGRLSLNAWAPDVVNAHMTAAESAALIADFRERLFHKSVPVVATRHFAAPRGGRRIVRPILRLSSRRLSAQIAVSHHVAACIEGSSHVVHTGVPARAHANAASREPAVLLAQRLEPEKGSREALVAFARSGLANVGWRLRIAGDGSVRRDLEHAAHKLGIADATSFLGYRSDVPELSDNASILLAPTPNEALGLGVLEAMAGGLPVIASASGGHLETVGSADGAAMFPPGDVDGAARLLRELAADETRRVAYGADLRAIQRERFTLEAQAEATDAVYRSVL